MSLHMGSDNRTDVDRKACPGANSATWPMRSSSSHLATSTWPPTTEARIIDFLSSITSSFSPRQRASASRSSRSALVNFDEWFGRKSLHLFHSLWKGRTRRIRCARAYQFGLLFSGSSTRFRWNRYRTCRVFQSSN
jgi:hypothetical protein